MSWLSELFGGGGGDQVSQQNALWQQYYANQQRLQDQAIESERQKRQDEAAAAQIAALQETLKPSPAQQRLSDIQAQQAADDAERARIRSQAGSAAGSAFAPGFESTYIPNALLDPYKAQAYTGQRQTAEDYLSNLLKRGVITQSGYAGGEKALEEQAPRVRSQLSDLADTILGAERGKITDIGNQARQAASTIDIGQTFDPTPFVGQAQQEASTFGSSLADKYLGQVPKGLFDITGIQQSAGGAQGAQNLPFDPNAIAGKLGTEEDTTATQPAPQKRTVSVF